MITEQELFMGSKIVNGQHVALTPAEIQMANDYYYPKPKAPAKPATKVRKISKANTGVRANTKTKSSNKSNMTIARAQNVIPLGSDAPGYTGLRIS